MSSREHAAYPRPASNRDYAFFHEGLARHELLVQQCAACGRVRNPPSVMCPHCRSLDWTPLRSSGRGTLHSYTVHHHPPIPPFALPHAIALVDMEEGFRFLAGMHEVAVDAIRIGLPVALDFVEVEPGYVLPLFAPAGRRPPP